MTNETSTEVNERYMSEWFESITNWKQDTKGSASEKTVR